MVIAIGGLLQCRTASKEQIIQAAMRLFGARGVDATSLQTIADEVGITKQAVLYHFPSKEALRDHIISVLLDHWERELPGLLSAQKSGEDRFSSILRAVIAFFVDDVDQARVTIREILDRPEKLRETMRERLSPWTMLIGEYIRMGQASGVIRSDVHPESYVTQIMMMAIGTVVMGDVVSALVASDHTDSRDNRITELIRIAHLTLFV
jgi:TetR/AcrR family transcriptional regulator